MADNRKRAQYEFYCDFDTDNQWKKLHLTKKQMNDVIHEYQTKLGNSNNAENKEYVKQYLFLLKAEYKRRFGTNHE